MNDKLEQLKTLVADMFKDAEDKESIEKLANINTTIDAVSKEQDSLISKNSELLQSYKDLVQHTSFKDDKKPGDAVPGNVTMPSFEDALNTFINKEK